MQQTPKRVPLSFIIVGLLGTVIINVVQAADVPTGAAVWSDGSPVTPREWVSNTGESVAVFVVRQPG